MKCLDETKMVRDRDETLARLETVSRLRRQDRDHIPHDPCLLLTVMAHDPSSPSKFWYQNLVPETWIVCQAFWYQIFLVPETWMEWKRVLFCTRNLESRDSHAPLALVVDRALFTFCTDSSVLCTTNYVIV